MDKIDDIDVHNYKRRLELALENVKKSKSISEKNRGTILDFCDYCFAEGLSVGRVEHYARILKKIAELYKKEFEDATKGEIVQLVGKIEVQKLSAWTKHDYRVTLRKFYRWLRKSEDYPQEVAWIKVGAGIKNNRLPEQLLTEKDAENLIKTCSDTQLKAIVAILWETGVRISELLNLSVRHIEPEEKLAKLVVKGKTGMRRVIILLAWPYLMQWLNHHPFKDNSSAPLWIKRSGEPMKYADVRKRLQTLARKARIRKPVNPHMFRHSRATFLAQHFTEAQLSQYLGWIPGTKMASVYVHLSSRDLVEPLLKLYGLEKEEKPKEVLLKPVSCWKCEAVNPADVSVCIRCGTFLKLEAALEAEQRRRSEINEMRRDISILKSMLLGHGPSKFRKEDLENIIDSKKRITEELRKHSLVTEMRER